MILSKDVRAHRTGSMLDFTEGNMYNDPVKLELCFREVLRQIEPVIQDSVFHKPADSLFLCIVYSGLGIA